MKIKPPGQSNGHRVPFAIWEKGGLTEHVGGVFATRRLLRQCRVAAGQRILDLGCGTGYTACLLAREYGAQVVAGDIGPRSVAASKERVARDGCGKLVAVIRADAHQLPCSANTFDRVIAESVLVFCQAERVLAEVRRVLKPGGFFGANELTLLRPPPAQLQCLLTGTLGIHAHQQETWQSKYAQAGFADVWATTHNLDLWQQLASHIQVDGVRNYLSAVVRGIGDTTIRRAFFTKDMLAAARQFMPYVGYGLYVGKKPD